MSEPATESDDFSMAFEAAFARLQVSILEACGQEGEWPRKVAAGVRAGLDLAAADPAGAQVLTNEALAQGEQGLVRRERLLAYLGERLRPGREERDGEPPLPEITEQAMTGGVLALVGQRLDRGGVEELPALAPEAVQFVLTPYLGAEEARRIAAEYTSPSSENG